MRKGRCQHVNEALQEPTADSDLIRVVSRQYAPYMQAVAWGNDIKIPESKLQTRSLRLRYICTYKQDQLDWHGTAAGQGAGILYQRLSYTIYLRVEWNPWLGIRDILLRYPGQVEQLMTRRLFTEINDWIIARQAG